MKKLKDTFFLENLIINLGLHDSSHFGTDRCEWPRELLHFVGKGIMVWQYPIQFSRYLVFLSQFQIGHYLEIGPAYGGSFVLTMEYLKRINHSICGYCIDIAPPSRLIHIYERHNRVTYVSAKSCELFKNINPETYFDLVFIDGDHSKEGVLGDFLLVKDRANMIAFHDIVDVNCPGVIEAWSNIKKEYKEEYDFFEFLDQYEKYIMQQPDIKFLGIGVAVKKELCASLL